MAYSIWDVSGRVIIPGTRKSGTFGPVRIVDQDRTKASKHLAVLLNEKFRKDLRGDHRFSDGFALMNLRWDQVNGKAAVSAVSAAQAAEVAVQVRAQEAAAE